MMYIMNRLEDAQQATTDERVRKVTEATSLHSRVSLSSYAALALLRHVAR